MTEDDNKKIRVELDHEHKVIHLGCWFYDLKGMRTKRNTIVVGL